MTSNSSDIKASGGRLTLPIERGIDDQIHALMERLQVDAVRNSDGTELPDWVSDGLTRVYATYFPARGDEEWARSVPEQRVRQFLMSQPVTATDANPLVFNVMTGYLAAQFTPDLSADRDHYWQVINRTTGETLPSAAWSVEEAAPLPMVSGTDVVGDYPDDAFSALVTIHNPEPFHVYTVNFLAKQVWDSTQTYNYITNRWADDPSRLKDRTYDVAYPETWEHVRESLGVWLKDHPEVDVVRFTTFFYHFTLAFNDHAKEKYVDWFGYSAAVSIPALEDFYREHGYRMTPEDFIDGGHYNTPIRVPSEKFKTWIDFTSRRVAKQAGELVKATHEAGREAIMFLGDNWIGVEPYGPYFAQVDMDAVVGSVGSAATCRMISDIPHVRYTEGRFLPYFFPDTFNPEGDPVGEAEVGWAQARRAIVRKPLDRIGYGGYLSLALQFPEFIDKMEEIVTEFRSLHDTTGGEVPVKAKPVVAVLNSWGALRTWQTYMVAHALWYKQIYSYTGVLESLAGLPLDVRFISFEDVLRSEGAVLDDIDVLINAGARDTAFSGGVEWKNPQLQAMIRRYVYNGGGFVGVGAPTAYTPEAGPVFQLDDVLGVDMEIHWTLSTTRHPEPVAEDHFITRDLIGDLDTGEDPGDIIAVGSGVSVLSEKDGSVKLSVNDFGAGRAVYFAGLPYSATNSRLLLRALMFAAHAEEQWEDVLITTNPEVEVAWYPNVNRAFVYNQSAQPESTRVLGGHDSNGDRVEVEVELPGYGSSWINL
ncbi:1,3-beta-galactosyl-N-acetylhexosamine phosphorylase [Actinomyces minihominis]|uniref:1,3-beta-galactosyl-N-acetylhexosamine phosphorylase n=1 Tax=Actinomyces minihominis TaxID=2002838 RepID=UPI000C0688EA|nr:1,3-beta-galactosyl-N-acetylhexosamine phosphorylase [Actinomyces minihominis]